MYPTSTAVLLNGDATMMMQKSLSSVGHDAPTKMAPDKLSRETLAQAS
jgi:hypothetical protein